MSSFRTVVTIYPRNLWSNNTMVCHDYQKGKKKKKKSGCDEIIVLEFQVRMDEHFLDKYVGKFYHLHSKLETSLVHMSRKRNARKRTRAYAKTNMM